MKTSFKFKNLIYSIILVPFVFAVLPQQNSSLEKTTEGNSAFSTIDPAKSKYDSYIEQVAMGGDVNSPDENSHSAAVLVDQNGNESLYTWGDNTHGQLGIGHEGNPNKETSYYNTPQKVTGLPEGDIEQISLGEDHSAAVVNDGSGDELYIWGENDKGQLGIGEIDTSSTTSPTKVDFPQPEGDIEQISLGQKDSAAIINNGESDELYTWGWNNAGQLGTSPKGNNESKTSPTRVEFKKFEKDGYQIKDITLGFNSSAAIITPNTDGDKTDHLYTWGNNDDGRIGIYDKIGDPYNEDYETPYDITDNFDNFDNSIIGFNDVIMGWTSSAVVAVDNQNKEHLYTWGSNDKGQLGIGEEGSVDDAYLPHSPTGLPEGDIEQISLYGKSTAVVINNGSDDELYTWGDSSQGQLGLGISEDINAPKKINDFDTNITQITSGVQSRMAITNNGTSLYVWGDNNVGQLGVEESAGYNSPHEIVFYSMIPDIPFVSKWYFYFILVILIFLIIGLIIGLVIYLKKRQSVR